MTQYFESGQVQSEMNYKDGKVHGKSYSYFESGQVQSEMNYKDGENDGIKTYYYNNGNIRFKGNKEVYKGLDYKVGIWTYYNNKGNIANEIDFNNGGEYGYDKCSYYGYEREGYNPRNQIKYQFIVIRDSKHQKYYKYDENGDIANEGYYKDLTDLGSGQFNVSDDLIEKNVKFYSEDDIIEMED